MLAELAAINFWQQIEEYKYAHYHIVYHYKIMIVAVLNLQSMSWVAYIGTVPGILHDHEWLIVRNTGIQVEETFARLFFNNVPTGVRYGTE